MEYLGPEHTDFHNVRSLNRVYLLLLAGCQPDAPPLAALPPDLARQLAQMSAPQCDRLAATPFLLFSFRERDDDYWERLLDDDGHRDLFDEAAPADEAARRLISAGMGFVWQLARQNPYTARLVCGASLHWCEQLAGKTLLDAVTIAAHSPDVLVMREAHNLSLWNKLLGAGVSREREVRTAAHISALQYVLTTGQRRESLPVAIAARSGLSPSLCVAEETEH